MDDGSTHNFVQPCVANFLDLSTFSIDPLQVMVGNGRVLDCSRICPQVALYVQGNTFRVDLFILGLNGVDIVLGIQWLQDLGPVLTDYTTRTMVFSYLALAYQLKRLAQTQSIFAKLHLSWLPAPTTSLNLHPSHSKFIFLPQLPRSYVILTSCFTSPQPYLHLAPLPTISISYLKPTSPTYVPTDTHTSRSPN